jgi:hypothetical protein
MTNLEQKFKDLLGNRVRITLNLGDEHEARDGIVKVAGCDHLTLVDRAGQPLYITYQYIVEFRKISDDTRTEPPEIN